MSEQPGDTPAPSGGAPEAEGGAGADSAGATPQPAENRPHEGGGGGGGGAGGRGQGRPQRGGGGGGPFGGGGGPFGGGGGGGDRPPRRQRTGGAGVIAPGERREPQGRDPRRGGFGGAGGGGGGGGGRRDERREDRGPTFDQLWPEYLAGGYFDTDGNLRLDLVSRERVNRLVRAMSDAYPSLSTNQLRRYFQHCRTIEQALRSKSTTWPVAQPLFLKLDAAAAEGWRGGEQARIPRLFVEFVRRNVAAVSTEHDFLDGFLPHFEALVGFGALHLKERRL